MKDLSLLLSNDKASGKPLLCLEINPPRGADVEPILERCRSLKGVDLLNITDSALAKMRMSGLVFAALLRRYTEAEPLVNLSCRDRNIIALQSDLLGAWAQGVRSVVALTGDAVTVGDLPDAKGVFEVNSIGLLHIISTLNGGRDLAGVSLKGGVGFVPGVVVNPNARNRDAEIRRLAKKRDAGAVYALSQPVFDADHAAGFFEAATGLGVHLFVGLLPFKSARTIEGILKVPGIKVPESVTSRVAETPEKDVAELSMALAMEVAERVKPFVRGYHVVSGGTPLLALTLCERLVSWIRDMHGEHAYEAPGGDDISRADIRR